MKKYFWDIEWSYRWLDYNIVSKIDKVWDDLIWDKNIFISSDFLKLFQPDSENLNEIVKYIKFEERWKDLVLATVLFYEFNIPHIRKKINIALLWNPYISSKNGLIFKDQDVENRYKDDILKWVRRAVWKLWVSLLIIRETDLSFKTFKKNWFFEIPSEPVLELWLSEFNTIDDYKDSLRSSYKRWLNKWQKTLEKEWLNWKNLNNEQFPFLDKLHSNVANRQPVMQQWIPFPERIRQLIANTPRILWLEWMHDGIIKSISDICWDSADLSILQKNQDEPSAFAFNISEWDLT